VAHIYAGILGLLAFLTSLARGALHGGSAESILLRAWCCLLAFAVIGLVIGWVADRIVADSVRGTLLAELEAEPSADSPSVASGSGE